MIFDIVTIFPEAFTSYFNTSILRMAQLKKKIRIRIHNLRRWTDDKHQTVDDRPFGGGPGMVMKIEPIYKAISYLKKMKDKPYVVLFSAKGKIFDQALAQRLSKKKRLILICGHYEGVDERVAQYLADEEISVGKYVLTGGEIPAMILVDAVSRLLPGVIKKESLEEESFKDGQETEYPQYTRPAVFKVGKKNWSVPKVLLSGDHKKISDWRKH
ncbi:MAG: tRNA (guanosine(37)-N1)-methyltransferase TrmD [Candidatus Parcubacteria bacterium]|nr:tRNA (guanosine(37)-N1)-methyltransferase TrmD [Candidatus Parcubacteria bacterium]